MSISWDEQLKILASDGTDYDQFGRPVSISGNYAIVGAHYVNTGSGAAYILKKSDTVIFKT